MTKEAKIVFLKKCALVVVGCIIYSFGIAIFLDPYNMAAGGVTGLSIIINYATGGVIGTGWLVLMINIPLFIIGWIFIGRAFFLSSLAVTLLGSGMMELWALVVPKIPPIDNMLVPAIIGGALFGIGLGLVFRTGSSTGGTDVVVKLVRKKFRYIKTGFISLSIDCCIVVIGFCVYQNFELLLTTVISIVVFSMLFNRALYGGNSAMIVQIITTPDRAQLIRDGLLKELDVGATIMTGKGAYSDIDKIIIMCVIKNYVYPRLRDVVKKYDTGAFTIVSSALEIYGQGYKSQDAEEL